MTRATIAACGAYATIGGITSFLGYVLDIPRLTDWYNNGISIQPNAALCVTFSGIALLLLAGGGHDRRGALVAAGIVLLIGGATLLEWISDLSLGIDDLLLFGRQWGRVGVIYPGRMGPPGTFCWMLIGTALLLTAMPRRVRVRRLTPALALVSVGISAVSLLGYLYDAKPLFSIPTLSVVAMQTSTFIMAVSVGIIALHPEREPMRTLSDPSSAGMLARRIAPTVVIVAVVLGIVRVRAQKAELVDTGMGVALHVLLILAMVAAPLWWSLAALRRREQALERQRRHYEGILTTTPDLAYIFDLNNRFIYANEGLLKFWGKTWDQAIGKNCLELGYEPGHAQLHDREIEQVVATRQPIRGQAPFIGSFGPRIYDYIFTPVLDERGAVVAVAGTARDVTQIKQTENQLGRQQQFLANLIESSPVAIAVVQGMDLRFTVMNPAYRDIAGASKPEVGRTYPEVFPEAAERGAAEQLRNVIRTRKAWKVFDFQTPIGPRASTWWMGEFMPLHNDAGAIDSVLIVTWDITERKEAEQAVRRSESIYRKLAEANLFGVGFGDSKGRVTYVNDEMLRMMGRTRQEHEAGAIDWVQCVAPEHRDAIMRESQRVLEEGRSTGYEAAFLRPDGGRTTYLGAAVLVEPGKDFHISIALDLTKIRAVEQVLRDREHELVEANRLKDEFLATLAHELRNPLAAIFNCVQLIRMVEPIPKLDGIGALLENQCKHMMRLIDDLLEVSRITRGKITLRREAVDVAEAVRQAVESCRAALDAHRHHLHIVLPEGPLVVEGDRSRLMQVFSNLIGNAAKFTDDGGRIEVSVAAGLSDGVDEAVVIIRDNGQGIEPEVMHRLFDLFFQADTTLDRAAGGMGIGLSLAKTLVEMHGGRVEARSEGCGRGSEFTVTLPRDGGITDSAPKRAR